MEATRLVAVKHKKIIKRFVKTLDKAEELARENRDVEALVAISDRWYALMESMDEESQQRLALGFVSKEKQDDSGKADHKRKS